MKERFLQAAVLVCCMTAASCGNAPTQHAVSEYSVISIATGDKEVATTYSASIRGRQDIDIYPQVSGAISQLCVNEGQIVNQGQTLFIIDQVPYKAALQTALANVEAAKASEATAQLTYDSKKELFAKNVISEFDLQTAKNTLLTVQAQLAQAQAQEVSARNNLSYTVVKSPSNGVVGTLPFRVGALVGPTIPKPLTTVSDNADMYVYFSMNENQLLDMTREYGSMEKAIQAMPDVTLQLSDGSVYDAKGRIASISGVIDASTGSVSLRAEFPNKGRLLHSGSSGSVIIPRNIKNSISIPQTATFEIQDKIYVYRVVDGAAKSAMIDVMKINNGTEYIVISGLTPGEQIVAEGVGLLREGTPIKVKGASEQPEAAQAAATTETGKEE